VIGAEKKYGSLTIQLKGSLRHWQTAT